MAGSPCRTIILNAPFAQATKIKRQPERESTRSRPVPSQTLDPALLTENARSYFSPEARSDIKQSLAAVGEPAAFELKRSNLRGGFITRVYQVTCSGRNFQVVVRATNEGLYEQYTVAAE